ncbi:MAG: DNA adenine methylase [Oscillospiraceae bacterium]
MCCKQTKKQEIIQSPLNYTGGKFKLLNQLLSHFPKHINTFVDLFCGGGNVGVNVPAERVIFNDNSPYLLYLYNTFKNICKETVLQMIDEIIEAYGLSRSTITVSFLPNLLFAITI